MSLRYLPCGLLLFLPATASFAGDPGSGSCLDVVLREAVARDAEGEGAFLDWAQERLDPRDLDLERVRVVIEADEPGESLLDELAVSHEDWDFEYQLGARAQVLLPLRELPLLDDRPGIRRVRLPWRPSLKDQGPGGSSAVVSEGRDLLFASDWHAQGLRGEGVSVAILDVGFQRYDTLLGTELPSTVRTRFLSGYASTEHGTAVAEIIHDIAPDASLELYTFSTDLEFATALDLIAHSGTQLVNGSIGFDNVWPADASSPITQAVDELIGGSGAFYVAAAGNENDKYLVGALSLVESEGETLVAIDGETEIQLNPWGGRAEVSLRWNDPIGGSGNDLDLYIWRSDGELCGSSTEYQRGQGYPYESVRCQAGPSPATVRITLEHGDPTGKTGFLYASYGLAERLWSETRNLTLPADNRLGLSVGAVEADEPGLVSYYSSRGPTEDGRFKPELVAPSGVSTSTYGERAFLGTSASSPHVTAMLALAIDAAGGSMSSEELRYWAIRQGDDLGDPGWDLPSGVGLLRPTSMPWDAGCGCRSAGRGPEEQVSWLSLANLVVVGLSILRSRRGEREKAASWTSVRAAPGAGELPACR